MSNRRSSSTDRRSAHPRYPDFIYPLDYGYLQGTAAIDGGGIDVWCGSDPAGRVDSILAVCFHRRKKEKADIEGCVYNLKCTELSREGTPEDEKIIDGTKYINSEPYGFENAIDEYDYTLFLPRAFFDELPEPVLQAIGKRWDEGEIPTLDDYVLYFPLDDVVFYGASGNNLGDPLGSPL